MGHQEDKLEEKQMEEARARLAREEEKKMKDSNMINRRHRQSDIVSSSSSDSEAKQESSNTQSDGDVIRAKDKKGNEPRPSQNEDSIMIN